MSAKIKSVIVRCDACEKPFVTEIEDYDLSIYIRSSGCTCCDDTRSVNWMVTCTHCGVNHEIILKKD